MVKIDFSTAIAGFLIIDLILVIGFWLNYTFKKNKQMDIESSRYFRQCPYCCAVFFDYQSSVLRSCPQCKSLMDTDVSQ